MMGSESTQVTGRSNGRTGPGAVFVCAHGKNVFAQPIVDWQPFQQYTFETPGLFPKTTMLCTISLMPIDSGTRVSMRLGRTRGTKPLAVLTDLGMRVVARFMIKDIKKDIRHLQDRIEEEMAEGKVVQLNSVDIPSDQIEAAVVDSLAR